MGKIAALTLYLALVVPLANAAGKPYTRVVRDFFSSNVALQSGGLPEHRALRELRNYLTPGFLEALRVANAVENECIRATPKGIKPPIWEGAIFSGSSETAERAKVGSPYLHKGQPRVPVRLYVIDKDASGNPEDTVGHVVVVSLSHVTGSWLISDLHYDDGKSLRSALNDFSGQRCGT